MKYCGHVTDPSWEEAWNDLLKGNKLNIVLSYNKEERERMCGQKIQYASEKEALNAMDNLSRKKITTSSKNCYFCPFCSMWHLGKKRRF